MSSGNGVATKYTEATLLKICDTLSLGASKRTAAITAGIAECTLHRWIAKHEDFAASVAEATERGIVSNLAYVQIAAKKDWRAAVWLLSKMDPARFSGKHHIEHSGTLTLAQAMADVRRRRDEIEGGPAALIETDADHSA